MSMSDIYNLGMGLIVVLFIIGLIPAFIAYSKNHAYRHIILVLCIFGSWTGILWIIAFIWSVWPSEKSATSQESIAQKNNIEKLVAIRECPGCTELINAAAIKCRFCQSSVEPIKIDLRNGSVTYTWANGDCYIGEFKNGDKNGLGTLTWTNGNRYVGDFKSGNLNGQGTFTWVNEGIYVGEFTDGKIHGQGTYTPKYGKRRDGIFKNGKYVGA